jgi:uncharacterized protein YndB with AHSA1/START domain
MNDMAKMVDEATLRIERTLPGPIDRVWSYLTDATKRAEWFAGGEITLKPGVESELVFDHRNLSGPGDKVPEKYKDQAGRLTAPVTIVDAKAPNLLVWEWQGDGGSKQVTRFELTPKGDKVVLTITESKFASRKGLIGNAAGWHTHLDYLKAILEGKEPPLFWNMHTKIEAAYENRFGV